MNNALRRTIVAGAVFAGSVGVMDSGNSVQAEGGYNVENILPRSCSALEVGSRVMIGSEQALVDAGFPGIAIDGRISNIYEQEYVHNAQVVLNDLDLLADSISLCGYAGQLTLNAIKLRGSPESMAGESQISDLDLSSNPNVSSATPNYKKRYSEEDCKNYDKWSLDTIKAVQAALGVRADGNFGSVTCNAMINFQESHGIAQYGKGFLGPRTLGALVVLNPKLETVNVEKKSFDPRVDYLTRYACEIILDKTVQKAYVENNSGETLWAFSVRTGRDSLETRNGTYTLGRVEYGENYNPWRMSSDLPSPSGQPNLYLYRRILGRNGQVVGGQGFHGSRYFSPGGNPGSHGCVNETLSDAETMSHMPNGTPVIIRGIKPGTSK